jgi:hypothetical protein
MVLYQSLEGVIMFKTISEDELTPSIPISDRTEYGSLVSKTTAISDRDDGSDPPVIQDRDDGSDQTS